MRACVFVSLRTPLLRIFVGVSIGLWVRARGALKHSAREYARQFQCMYTRRQNRLPSGNLATLHVGSPCVEEPLSYT